LLTCRDAGAPAAYPAARDDHTEVTRAFSGRPARGVVNDWMLALRGKQDAILPFPPQIAATRPLRNEAARRGDTRYLSRWAGQAAGLARDLPAAELINRLVREADEVAARLPTP
jgi:nitronate monooxygenase